MFGCFGIFDGFGFEYIDCFELVGDVIGGGFEGCEVFFDFVDDGLVFEDGVVVGKVDGGGEFGKLLDFVVDVVVVFFEGLEVGDCLVVKVEWGGDFGLVDFESCVVLEEVKREI